MRGGGECGRRQKNHKIVNLQSIFSSLVPLIPMFTVNRMRIPFIFPLHQFSRIKYRIRRRLFTHKASTCFLHFGCDSQECKWQFYDEGMMMAIAWVESQDDKSFFLASLHWITLSSVAAAVRATIYLTMMEILPVAKAEKDSKPWISLSPRRLFHGYQQADNAIIIPSLNLFTTRHFIKYQYDDDDDDDDYDGSRRN